MSTPKELSFEEILKFMLAHNGQVTNHDLVKHFKVFLTNPDMRDEARNSFKKHVNTLAIIKNQNNEKWLILKKKYMPNNNKENEDPPALVSEPDVVTPVEFPRQPTHELAQPPYRSPPPVQLNQDFNILTSIIQDCQATVSGAKPLVEPKENFVPEDIPPKIHPRKKSSEKIHEKRSNTSSQSTQKTSTPNQVQPVSPISSPVFSPVLIPDLTMSSSESMLVDNEHKISVKERKQMFNRMASESDVMKSNKLGSSFTQDVDEEDTASLEQKSEVHPLDLRQKAWLLCAARGDYHALAKMCKDNPKLVKTKDPFTTALHWACKRGDENLVKLLAGVTRQVVNERSGYTPLHLAMQFRHENVFRLLVEVYDADPNVRDWSGKKPRQYLVYQDTSFSPGSYRKADSLDSRMRLTTSPDIKVTTHDFIPQPSKKESFLRIGSLNVRVKKTTEAFSNFLGVGANRSFAYIPKSRDRDGDHRRRSEYDNQLHKTWGSADNIQEDKFMPPPMSGKVKRRSGTSRRVGHSRSTPSTPDQPRAQIGTSEEENSDSDSAAGFHAAWRHHSLY